MAELVAAGIEGGSWDSVLDNWTLDRVAIMRRHWRECVTPVHIGIACLSAAWGNKLTKDATAKRDESATIVDLSEVDLSDVHMPVAGVDTLAASRAILAKLKAMHGG